MPAGARLGRRLRRVGVPMLVMAPFTIYAFLGLGIPVISVIYKAFHSETGKLTTANIRLLTTASTGSASTTPSSSRSSPR